MAVFNDKEFGPVTIRRSKLSRQVKLSVAPNGTLRVSMPLYAPIFLAKRLVNSSRMDIRQLLTHHVASPRYTTDGPIGKSHSLTVHRSPTFAVRLAGRHIIVSAPNTEALQTPPHQTRIRDVVAHALRREAKSYLPKRLQYLAEQHGFQYQKVRFSHASTRWGSCSSSGTISLNIALMKLPFELIDYVLLHELCHTKEMNHSAAFWGLLESVDPKFRTHRRLIKAETPSI